LNWKSLTHTFNRKPTLIGKDAAGWRWLGCGCR